MTALPTDPRPPATHRHAFTLIELIIVVAIIATLTAILIPSIGMLIGKANLASCTNNLRQVGMAAIAYAFDNDNLLPAESNKGEDDPAVSPAWFYRLPPYVGGRTVADRITVFQCPVFEWRGGSVFDHASPKSYKMNSYLDNRDRPTFYELGSEEDERDIVLFLTAKAGETGTGQWGHCPASAVEDRYHNGIVNILYLDGHTLGQAEKEPDEDWRDTLKWESASWE